VVSANGFAGTVATATSTPAITIQTSITGVLKGNGTAISAAVAGTDYVTPTGTETLTNKTLTAPTIASANLTTALTLAGAAGTNGQVLTSAGSGLPTWATPSSGASAATPTALGTVYAKQTTSGGTPFLTAFGYNAAVSTTGVSNTAAGTTALFTNSTGANNTAIGYESLYLHGTGDSNTALGSGALRNNDASYNTAVGYQALYANTTGYQNIAIGGSSLSSNIDGTSNTAIGQDALFSNTSGYQNTASGMWALYSNTTGLRNTAIGMSALFNTTTGSYNVGVGRSVLNGNTTGSGNTGFNPWTAAGSNSPVFSVTTQDNRVVMGSTAVTNAYVQVAWTVVSDARDKMNFAPVPHGLDFVKQLNPLSFQFKENRESDVAHGPVRYGFKAQDILALEGSNPVIIDAEDSEKLRYNGEALVPVLVKALQELNAKFDAYVASHP
jgi:hypothetical protein